MTLKVNTSKILIIIFDNALFKNEYSQESSKINNDWKCPIWLKNEAESIY